MQTGSKTVCSILLAATLLVTHFDTLADGLGSNKNLQTIESTYTIQSSSEGIGSEQQEDVIKAGKLIELGKLAEADNLLDAVLHRYAGLMNDSNLIYVSFRDTKDYRQFLDEIKARQGDQARLKVTRVNDSFTQALQLKAYIASSRQQWDKAMVYLDKKIAYAPYEAQPHLEKGYILNSRGQPQQGYDAYQTAYALAVSHNSARQEQAAALRGMGSTQIELGKLDEAVVTFQKSLEIEPGNKTALGELEYIRQMKEQGR